MQHCKKNRRGFTLVELVTVVAIVAILAAVAAPSVANFVESGRQQSRHNIARTLYVAAQNRLTELRVTDALSDRYYTLPAGAGGETGQVSDRLGGKFPAADADNAAFVRYISKPAGETSADHPVNLLLAPVVVDPSILFHAICIEYNIQTGVVMSVFYSDTADRLVYSGTGDDTDILGDRPYADAAARKQGYYGVDSTGVAVPVELPDAVQIYDGASKPLTDSAARYDNLLYAEIYLPRTAGGADQARTLAITDAGKTTLVALADTNFSSTFTDTLAGALAKAGADSTKQILYCANSPAPSGSVVQYGADISAAYDRYVWVLDYVNGDQLRNGTPHSIQAKYLKDDGTPAIGAQELRVAVQRADAAKPVVSLSKAHSLYMAQTGLLGKSYTLATSRHLSNLRYNPAAEFHQIQSFSMKPITNFKPLPAFTGKYIAKGGSGSLRVSDLVIDTTGLAAPFANVGLFEEIGSSGSVLGLSLKNATVTAQSASNVGSLAGVVGGRVSQSNSFANVTAAGKAANVGGLVGDLRKGAYLDQSYNGGYFDATERAAAPHYGSVRSDGGNIGGLVGRSAGSVQNSYNNARVNIRSVIVSNVDTDTKQWLSQSPVYTPLGTGMSGNFGGLVGQQITDGSMSNCYATNFVASYPSPSRSGGLIGDGAQGLTSCYYLTNGILGPDAKSKAELYTIFGTGGLYTAGAPYLQGQNEAAGYPYPVLTGNPHLTGYEDIESETLSKPVLQYYEAYQNPDKQPTDPDSLLWGYYSPDGRSTLRQDLLAVTDGYCVDLAYGNSYTFKLSNGSVSHTFVLTDPSNNAADPRWAWSGSGLVPTNLPLPYKADEAGTLRYRLYLRNDMLEDFSLGNTPLQLTVTSRSGGVLLSQSFSPYFAMAFGTELKNYVVRTPRQLDNIDRLAITYKDKDRGNVPVVTGSAFTQQLDLDFAVYYKELLAASAADLAPDRSTRLAQQGSIVDAVFSASYDGEHHFIRNMELQAGNEDSDLPVDNSELSGRGLFAEIGEGGTVQRLALLRSSVEGSAGSKRSLGGIAGVLGKGGKIVQCELSEVTVHNTGNKNNYIGGVVGQSHGRLEDVYFNSTNRSSTGLYTTPITGSDNAGGLVGHNSSGTLVRCYTTAVAPVGNPIVGSGGLPAGSTAYYLSALGYNDFKDPGGNKGIPLGPEPELWEATFVRDNPSIWENAQLGTTKDTDLCQGLAYLYPKLKGTHHYYDWPILSTLLKYYERYDDLSYGYYYYINQYAAPVNTLRYDPDRTVIEDGYLISTLTDDNYDIVLTDAAGSKKSLTNQLSETMDGQRVIKLRHSEVETLAKVTANRVQYVKAEASALTDKNEDGYIDDKDFKNELAGLTIKGSVWFNPRFARAIKLTNPDGKAPETAELEVRSPRHLLQIEANPTLKNHGFVFNQTCSINMRVTPDPADPNNYYSLEQRYTDAELSSRTALAPVGAHLITGTFIATYNAQYAGSWSGKLQSDTKRLGGYRINNLIMNAGNKAAGMFELIGTSGKVMHLELVDAQMRFSTDSGQGGGTLAATSKGTVQNIRVWHTVPTYLFAGADGTVDASYCFTGNTKDWEKKGFSHVHGGVVGYLTGPTAMLRECVVGTSDATLEMVIENNTKINCFPVAFVMTDENKDFIEKGAIPIGGIVGQADTRAVILSSTNIATITSDITSDITHGYANLHQLLMLGGIVGRVGPYREKPGVAVSGVNLYGCYNAGSVRTSSGWAGGIAARANGYSEIFSCYNTGRINIYTDENGELQKTAFMGSLRIAGILAETNAGPTLGACYNIGYVSDVFGTSDGSRSGAIIGVPGYGRSEMSSCFSLKANKYAPVGITGETYAGGIINDQSDLSIFETWESRAALRSLPALLTKDTGNHSPDGLWTLNVFPFTLSTTPLYIFPEFTGGYFNGIELAPPNYHFTPWESIDAIYDTTLKYYEKYSDDSVGHYYLDLIGTPINTLAGDKDADDKAKTVVEDGYLLELGKAGKYDVKINGQTFTVDAKEGLLGEASRIGLTFTEDMVAACKPGYNRIQFFTRLGDKSDATPQDREDDMLNRIVGSTSATNLEGIDLYFDYSFPKELRYGTVKTEGGVTTGVPPVLEPNHSYEIRSVRHLIGIGTLTQATPDNMTAGKTFTQTRELDAANYQYRVGLPAGYRKTEGAPDAVYPGVLVPGSFMGSYNGGRLAITGLRLVGAADAGTVGIFAQNSGTITRMLLRQPVLSSAAGSGTALTMGAVAAVNNGTVNLTAIYQPAVVGSAAAPTQTIGGVVGVNNAGATLADINLVCADGEAVPVRDGDNPLGGTLGGMVGQNKGTVSDSIYLALAPALHPIVGANVDSGTVKPSVWYLAGQGYNQFYPGENAGTPKATAQFTDPPNGDWGGLSASYPYPWLTNMPQPPTPTTVLASAYTLAYYERYAPATPGTPDSYGWYFSTDGGATYTDTLDKTNTAKLAESGYAALLLDSPDPATDAYDPATEYTVRFGSHKVVLPANKHTGLVDLSANGKQYKAVLQSKTETPVPADSANTLLVTVNSFGMQDNNSYCNPGFAKAISSTAAGKDSYAVRNEQHLLNVGKLLAIRTNPVIKQERSLDLTAYPQTASVVNTVLRGSYDGGYQSADTNPIVIRNLNVAYTPDITDATAIDTPVGLFRENAGTIQNVRLVGSVSVTGANNVGGIVGINRQGGTVTGCSINITDPAAQLLVKGQERVGGIAGVNSGVISHSSVVNSAINEAVGNIVSPTVAVGGIAGQNSESGVMNTGLQITNLCIEGAAATNPLLYVGENIAASDAAASGITRCYYKAFVRVWLASEGVPFAEALLPAPTGDQPIEQTLSVELPSGRRARGVSALDLFDRLETLGTSALRTLRSWLVPSGGSGFTSVLFPSGASGLSSLPDRADSGLLLAPRTIIFALDDLPVGYRLDSIEAIEPGEHYLPVARLPQLNGCIFTAEFTHTLLQFTLVSDDETLPTYQYSVLLELTEHGGNIPGWSGSPSTGLSAAGPKPDEQR